MQQVRVAIHASDRLSLAGLAAYLRPSAGLVIAPLAADGDADVVLAVADSPADVVSCLKLDAQRRPGTPMIVVAGEVGEEVAVVAAQRGVRILDRLALSHDELVGWIKGAAAGGKPDRVSLKETIPPATGGLGRFAADGEQRGVRGFERREIEVLRLLADGLDTHEIACRLFYSERTVKNILSRVTARMNLRNRPHAVAYAVRVGAI